MKMLGMLTSFQRIVNLPIAYRKSGKRRND